MVDLLPHNSTPLERGVAAAFRHDSTNPLRTLYNPDTCPVEVLPMLAWAWSVDRWDDQWSVATKRAACRNAYVVHRQKGTIAAIRAVVEPFGYLLKVYEWFQLTPMGVPGTFSLEIGVQDTGITERMYEELAWLIDDARPVSRHMVGLDISLMTSGSIYIAGCTNDGDVLEVFPPEPRDIDVSGIIGLPGRETTTDYLDVY
ncbi:phage tail protein I [Pseudomonas syringae]|nr:phage tail protein I [Pseudomonas syringae]MBD8802302.1 phage tail protein I [Pseudomonas syringae]MBD8812873.1 phage tail protein I [Pseudomonas syringae]